MWVALAVSSLAAVVTLAGILTVRWREQWVRRHRAGLTALAAAILLTISFLHLVPKAFEAGGHDSGAGLLAGFLLLYLVSRLVTAFGGGAAAPERTFGFLALFAIGFHSFLDGLLFAIGFAQDPATGFIIAPGMVLHEFVEGALVYKLLLFGGFRRGQAFWLALAAAGLTTPLGVLVSWPLIVGLQAQMTGLLIAFAAGALIYVGGSHLLPHSDERQRSHAPAFLAGVGLAVLIVLLNHR